MKGKLFIQLQQVESTNNYATSLIHAGMAQHGLAVFANHQTAGRGQRKKQWFGSAGKNIFLSIIIQPDKLLASQTFQLSMAIALATQKLVALYAGDAVKIKWPNDVYWQDRKAAGILIENIIQGNHWKWSVVGIGVNVNEEAFVGLEAKAVSIKQITGRYLDPLLLAKELQALVVEAFNSLQLNPATTITKYNENLYKLNQPVRFKKASRLFEAVVKEVTAQGQLIVQHATEERFTVGEVEWLI